MRILKQDKVHILMFLALVLMKTAAEHQYFPQPGNLTWDKARDHCQVCFKDLVTLTPNNIQKISRMLSSEHWIGLRKTFNSSIPWSRWSNGDPLAFQNWYLGRPVPKSPLPKVDCCSCSCTCPATPTPSTTPPHEFRETTETPYTNSTYSDGFDDFDLNGTNVPETRDFPVENVTIYERLTYPTVLPTTAAPPIEAACEKTPMLPPPVVPEVQQDYVEDPCVAILSFGAWVEKNCSESLPFICYEDIFLGRISVTNVNSESVTLTWLRAPGDISHYRVEVNNDMGPMDNLTDLTTGLDNLTDSTTDPANLTDSTIDPVNLTDLTTDLDNLVAGTRYTVKVFPVKCERDLNPQSTTFYTIPHKVKDFKVETVNEKDVSLSWNKPDGNADLYLLRKGTEEIETKNHSKVIDGLIPGGCYTFAIRSGVKDKSRWSEESSVAVCTKPGKVSSLTVSNNNDTAMLLTWEPPEGNFTGFTVKADAKIDTVENSPGSYSKQLTDLPDCQEIHLSVTAMANYSILGETVETVNHTAPRPVSNLTLNMNDSSLEATWDMDKCLNYSAQLFLNGERVDETTTKENTIMFKNLKTAAYYTVVVRAISGHLMGPAVKKADYTKPKSPTDAKVTVQTKNTITFEWKAPDNTATVNYSVKLNSTFWNQSFSDTVMKETSYTFDDLMSGSNYTFEVFTLAGEMKSSSSKCESSTVPDKRKLTLSMQCSSEKPLHCDSTSTREWVLAQLHNRLKEALGKNVFWELNHKEP